jgi:hypothetical protein
MKQLTLLSALALILTPALAAANPVPGMSMYISFESNGDPSASQSSPPAFSDISAYVCLEQYYTDGITTVSFRLNDIAVECPGVMASRSFSSVLPGGLSIGDAFSLPGITIASTECMTQEITVLGEITGFYLGGDCTFTILAHGEYPLWVVDCQDPGHVWYYEETRDGQIVASNPVEERTWGNLKALYR